MKVVTKKLLKTITSLSDGLTNSVKSMLKGCHVTAKGLGDNATSKYFFNLFMDDNYLDEIVKCSIANTQSKGDEAFAQNFNLFWAKHLDGNPSPSPAGPVLRV